MIMNTTTIPDNTQLQLHNDVVNCNRCKADYAVQVALDLKNLKTKCPWCEKVQEYGQEKARPLAPNCITPGKENSNL